MKLGGAIKNFFELTSRIKRAPRDICESILVVDDDPDFLSFISDFIKFNFEFRPLLADSAWKAMEHIRKSPVRIIISDTNMPGRSGVHLMLEARAHDPTLKVIMLFSGTPGSRICEEDILRLGAHEVLEKMEIPSRLLSILRRCRMDSCAH